MKLSNKILSEITTYMKYAQYSQALARRETWEELVTRNKEMHIKKYPRLADVIESVYQFVYSKKILPSMRSLQFGGKPIEISPNRIYNCAYLPIDDWRAFGETMFLLLGGTGVGYSVQQHHVDSLPEIIKPDPKKARRYLISDSIEGWADAVKMLVKSYFHGGATINFDFSDIRLKGTRLVTSGGKAPGPQPLKECLVKLQGILDSKQNNEKLTPIEVHDMICHIADAVLAGGIRRAALISLFSADDEDMIACKSGPWWELNPQRGRANNSAVLLRNKITKEFFMSLWKKIEASGAGEPGIYFSNDKDWGTNPCCFVSDTQVLTDDGVKTIKEIVDIVNAGKTCNVKTFNEDTNQIEIKTVLAGQLTKENATIVKMTIEENGILYTVECTTDHKFMTRNRGWVECKDLTSEDDIIVYHSIN
jgi:ribonucleoside-diphosphate reductase alpha chain